MEPEPQQVSISRYLRFVVAFLLIMFGTLGVYQYYYGQQAKELLELQRGLEGDPASSARDTTTPQ